jgi:hypothetical protein
VNTLRARYYAWAFLACVLSVGCGEDDKPAAPEGERPPYKPNVPFVASRSGPDSLLTSWFERVHTNRDSVHLSEMLAEDFEFQFTPGMADTLRRRGLLATDSTWGKGPDVSSISRVFHSGKVDSTWFDIRFFRTNVPDSLCEGCRRIEAAASLGVLVQFDRSVLFFGGDLEQTFIVGPDPRQPGLWVIRRQIDDQYLDIYKSPSSIPDSWSWIKTAFLKGLIG